MARRGGIARRSGLVLRGGRMVRESIWADFVTTETTLGGAPTAVLINVTGAALLAQRPWTIVRTRGILHVRSDQTGADETFIGDLGMAVVSDQAAAIGITAVPTPLTDKGSDLFFVYQQIMDRVGVGTGVAAAGVATTTGKFMEYDSKAMRRCEEGSQIVTVVENEISGCVLTHSARALIKLH